MSARSSQDAARVVARYVAALRYEDLPPHVTGLVKQEVLDTLGVALAGSGLGQGSLALAALVKEAGGAPESTLIGFRERVPCWDAALVNGALAHAIDYDDIYGAIMMHLSGITVPAALAVAERVGGVSGKEFITAVALGNEVATRLGLAMFRAPQGFSMAWHPTLLAGYFSATAAAGKVLGLDEERIACAFGISLFRTAGTIPFLAGARTLVAELYYGFPAQAGVLSALMAQRGVTGPPDAFEGKGGLFRSYLSGNYHRGSLTQSWGKTFAFTGVELKPWPSARLAHCYIQAALDIVRERGLHPDDVSAITVYCGPKARAACEPLPLRRRPATAIDAKFSIPFVVAVAVAKGNVTIRDFSPEGLRDPQVLRLADKVLVKLDPSLDSSGDGTAPAIVAVKTKAGRTYSARVDQPKGHPSAPLTSAELAAKFRECASYAARPLPAKSADRIIRMVFRLETVDDMSALVRLLS